MRTRWQEWVIVLSIVTLGCAGVWTLWGDVLMRVFRPEGTEPPVEAQAPAQPAVTPPAGPAAGPF